MPFKSAAVEAFDNITAGSMIVENASGTVGTLAGGFAGVPLAILGTTFGVTRAGVKGVAGLSAGFASTTLKTVGKAAGGTVNIFAGGAKSGVVGFVHSNNTIVKSSRRALPVVLLMYAALTRDEWADRGLAGLGGKLSRDSYVLGGKFCHKSLQVGQYLGPRAIQLGQKIGEHGKEIGFQVGQSAAYWGVKVGQEAVAFGGKIGRDSTIVGGKIGKGVVVLGSKAGQGAVVVGGKIVQSAGIVGSIIGQGALVIGGEVGGQLSQGARVMGERFPLLGALGNHVVRGARVVGRGARIVGRGAGVVGETVGPAVLDVGGQVRRISGKVGRGAWHITRGTGRGAWHITRGTGRGAWRITKGTGRGAWHATRYTGETVGPIVKHIGGMVGHGTLVLGEELVRGALHYGGKVARGVVTLVAGRLGDDLSARRLQDDNRKSAGDGGKKTADSARSWWNDDRKGKRQGKRDKESDGEGGGQRGPGSRKVGTREFCPVDSSGKWRGVVPAFWDWLRNKPFASPANEGDFKGYVPILWDKIRYMEAFDPLQFARRRTATLLMGTCKMFQRLREGADVEASEGGIEQGNSQGVISFWNDIVPHSEYHDGSRLDGRRIKSRGK